VNDKGRPERLAAIGHIAEKDTGKQTADGFYLRLAYMHQHKRNHLDEDAALFKFLLQSEQQKTPVHIFNGGQAETIHQEIVQKIEVVLLIVFLQRRYKGTRI